MFCTKCGKQLSDDSKFCTNCGTTLDQTADEQSLTTPTKIDLEEDKTPSAMKNSDIAVTTDTPSDDSIFSQNQSDDTIDSVDIPKTDDTVLISESDNTVDNSNNPNTSLNEAIFDSADIPAENSNTYDNTPIFPQSNEPVTTNQNSSQPFSNDNYYQPNVPTENIKDEVNVGGGRLTAASIIAFFSIIFMILLGLICSVKFGITGNILKNKVNKLNAKTTLEMQVDGRSLSDNLYDMAGIRNVSDADTADFKEFLVEADFLGYVAINVEAYANYILNGKGDDPSLTASDFTSDFFKKNNDVADDVLGAEFSKSDLKSMTKNIEKNDFNNGLSIEEWENEIGFKTSNIKYALSYITIGILAAIIIVLCLWTAVIVDRKGKHLLGFYGNIMLISGIIMTIVGLGSVIGMSIAYAISNEIMFQILFTALTTFGIIALIIGVVQLLFGFIFKKIKKGIVKKQKAQI